MQTHPKLVILQDSALCQHWLTSVLWQGCWGGRVLAFPNRQCQRAEPALDWMREGALQLRDCPPCVSFALHMTSWSGGVEMPSLALMPAKPHIFWSAWGVQRRFMGISDFCLHASAQLLSFLCQDPPSQQAAVLSCSQVPWRWVFRCPWSPTVSSVHTTRALGSKAFVLPTTNF